MNVIEYKVLQHLLSLSDFTARYKQNVQYAIEIPYNKLSEVQFFIKYL